MVMTLSFVMYELFFTELKVVRKLDPSVTRWTKNLSVSADDERAEKQFTSNTQPLSM